MRANDSELSVLEAQRADEEPIEEGGPAAAPYLVLGALLLLSGAALVAVPRFLPHHAWVCERLVEAGLTAGPLLVGGLLFLGLGLFARGVRTAFDDVHVGGDEDSHELLDQLGKRMRQMRAEVRQVQTDVKEMHAELGSVKEAAEYLAQRGGEAGDGGKGSEDAIFRLAASMDKLSAQVSDRLQKTAERFRTDLQELRVGMAETQRHVAELAEAAERAPAPATSNGRKAEPEPLHAPRREREKVLRMPANPAPEAPAEGDLEVWVDLEEGGQEHDSSLGLLDDLDDFGRPAGAKTSPSERPAPSAPELLGLVDHPSIQAAEILGEKRRGGAVDDVTADTLRQLKSLLADSRVRAALENMRDEA